MSGNNFHRFYPIIISQIKVTRILKHLGRPFIIKKNEPPKIIYLAVMTDIGVKIKVVTLKHNGLACRRPLSKAIINYATKFKI